MFLSNDFIFCCCIRIGFTVLENFRNVLQRLVSRKDRGDPVQIDQKPEVLQAGIENPQYDSRSYITWMRTK